MKHCYYVVDVIIKNKNSSSNKSATYHANDHKEAVKIINEHVIRNILTDPEEWYIDCTCFETKKEQWVSLDFKNYADIFKKELLQKLKEKEQIEKDSIWEVKTFWGRPKSQPPSDSEDNSNDSDV